MPCACATLRRAARAVSQVYGRKMRECGLEITQFTLLQVLHSGGELTQGGLGEILAMDSTTLSRTLRLLEKRDLIAVRPGRDRRERLWRITRAGERTLDRAQSSWQEAQTLLRQALGEAGWKTMMTWADTVTVAAQGI
jgi:DNA-binding MarR family transcriptional regulator